MQLEPRASLKDIIRFIGAKPDRKTAIVSRKKRELQKSRETKRINAELGKKNEQRISPNGYYNHASKCFRDLYRDPETDLGIFLEKAQEVDRLASKTQKTKEAKRLRANSLALRCLANNFAKLEGARKLSLVHPRLVLDGVIVTMLVDNILQHEGRIKIFKLNCTPDDLPYAVMEWTAAIMCLAKHQQLSEAKRMGKRIPPIGAYIWNVRSGRVFPQLSVPDSSVEEELRKNLREYRDTWASVELLS